MKEMIKRVREEKGGFTLAELLIVVAILLVLIAIAVPLFTGALGKAEDAVDRSNERASVSEAKVDYQLGGKDGTIDYYYYYDGNGNELAGSGPTDTGGSGSATVPANAAYKYKVTISKADGSVAVTVDEAFSGKVEGGSSDTPGTE